MTRRELLSLGALFTIVPRFALAQEPHTPFTDWVWRFYLAQIAVRARREGWATAETDAGAEATLAFPFHEYLTPDMRALYARAAADAPDGPLLDELFGLGVLPGRPIRAAAVNRTPWWKSWGEGEHAIITLDIDGNQRNLTLTGRYDAPLFNWEIADIDYGASSDETLRERLERLAG